MKKIVIYLFMTFLFSCSNYVDLNTVIEVDSSSIIPEYYTNLEYLFIAERINFKRSNSTFKILTKDVDNIDRIKALCELANDNMEFNNVLKKSKVTDFTIFGE